MTPDGLELTPKGKAAVRHELDLYQAALPVRLIATDRQDFCTCGRNERIADVLERNRSGEFDHLPVMDADGNVVGVLDAHPSKALPGGTLVEAAFEPVSEKYLVGAEASILDFLQQADTRPFRFVVTSNGISGLVSLSDVQKLPVRAALFAMVTQIEITMARLIEITFEESDWWPLLSEGRREKLQRELETARKDNNQVSPLLYTQFADKTRIVREIIKMKPVDYSVGTFKTTFGRFEKLRNALAHANELGTTREAAAQLAACTREMCLWLDRLEQLTRIRR